KNQPTNSPIASSTPPPSDEPTSDPTSEPTNRPPPSPSEPPTTPALELDLSGWATFDWGGETPEPSRSPSASPTPDPTGEPTGLPTSRPSDVPASPTPNPTGEPTGLPTSRPSDAPTSGPAGRPTDEPTVGPTPVSTGGPTRGPTRSPTPKPAMANPEFYAYVGKEFFEDNMDNEASGIDVAPDGSHLVVASDDGKIFFLNLLDYDAGHCLVDLGDNDGRGDFEGVAFDPTVWREDDKIVYIVHEGADDDEPILFELNYEYDNNGNCDVKVGSAVSLYGAMPCLPDSNGIESLTLKRPSSDGEPAVFFVGVQDTGKLYEVTSDGASAGPNCYHGGLGVDDLGASSYDGTNLWSVWGEEDKITVIDPTRNCLLATYDIDLPEADKEGLLVDFDNDLVYVAVDGQGDPSTVAVFNFTFPRRDFGDCEEDQEDLCSNFVVCGIFN
ncbi:hypothetical protein ACHAWF_010081, partial [Thalassiosira exigua]